MPKESSKKGGSTPAHWLGDLNETTRLVATSNCFVIRKRSDPEGDMPGQWHARYFYPDIKSALQKEIEVMGDKLDLEWKAKNPGSGLGNS